MTDSDTLDKIYTKINDIENRLIVLETKIGTIGNLAKVTIGAILGIFGINFAL